MGKRRRSTNIFWIALIAAALAVPAAIADGAGSSSLEAKVTRALKLANQAKRKAGDALLIAKETSQQEGPPGPQGEKGEPGEPATSLFATISSNGTLRNGSGVTGSSRLGLGRYEVVFDQDVTACALIGTPGSVTASGSEPPHRSLSTAPRSGNANAVSVITRDANGIELDSAFHLAIFC